MFPSANYSKLKNNNRPETVNSGRKAYLWDFSITPPKETKEEKQDRKIRELLQKYGLEDLSEKDTESIRLIANELMGTGLMETGIALTGKAEDNLKIHYLRALVEQNWIIIRLLDQIAKKS